MNDSGHERLEVRYALVWWYLVLGDDPEFGHQNPIYG